MKLELFVSLLTPQEAFHLGGIMNAWHRKERMILKLTQLESREREAQQHTQSWYMANEASDTYDCAYREATVVRRSWLEEKISAEKHFKKLCWAFKEQGGTKQQIDELVLILKEMQKEEACSNT